MIDLIPTLSDSDRRQKMSQALADMSAGIVVDLIDASQCAYSLCIGDFRDVDLSERLVSRSGMAWKWKGPGSVRLSGGEVLTPGTTSEWVDMDWL